MGVGAPNNPEMDLADYVLGKFTDSESKVLGESAEKIEENLNLIIKRDYQALMGKLNIKI
jgi:peptidyl-tRNA hydrolase